MSEAIELPENVWAALQEAAKARGVTPAGWIAAHLPAPDANGTKTLVDDEGPDNREPPTYTSVPRKRVGTVQVVCVTGRERPPLPYTLDDRSE